MIKTIICPTDFSPASQNAVQYAAKLAQLSGARLYFVSVVELTPLEAIVTSIGGESAKVSKLAGKTTARLEELCREVNRLFGVSAEFEVDASAAPFHRVFSGADYDDKILVTGTNGEDNLMQKVFGSGSFGILKDWKGPMLVVPENVSYGTVKKMVYAWGEHLADHFDLSFLQEFVKLYDPTLICLHVAEPRSLPGALTYAELRSSLREAFGDTHNVLFERLDAEQLPESLQDFVNSSKADMLIVNSTPGHMSMVKKLIAYMGVPVLIIPA